MSCRTLPCHPQVSLEGNRGMLAEIQPRMYLDKAVGSGMFSTEGWTESPRREIDTGRVTGSQAGVHTHLHRF